MRTSYDKAQILKYPFLLEEDEKYGGDIPSRTYWGKKYHGGYSDHLPVCVDFEIGKIGRELVVSDEWTALLCRRC